MGVLVHARAAADDLLELGHRADLAIERDQPAGLDVDAGREQSRGRDEYRVLRLGIDEVVELLPPLRVVARDPHHVARVLLHEVGVLVDQRLPHASGVLRIHAEDDRLLESIAPLLQELRDLARDELGAAVEHDRAIEVAGVVEAIFDLRAVPIELAGLRPIALDIPVDVDLHDLVRSEEAVADALLQRV